MCASTLRRFSLAWQNWSTRRASRALAMRLIQPRSIAWKWSASCGICFASPSPLKTTSRCNHSACTPIHNSRMSEAAASLLQMDCTSSRKGPMWRELSMLMMAICASSRRSIMAPVVRCSSRIGPRSLKSLKTKTQSVHSSRISVKRASSCNSLCAAVVISCTSSCLESRSAAMMLASRKELGAMLKCLPVAFISIVQCRERIPG
mmetsp:Transcript_18016/g.50189  ORF Transcript_18016/g.50189 Transcript_18016/m.50189 type:complete len:205 (-) Transcript_18016:635-1249(-)